VISMKPRLALCLPIFLLVGCSREPKPPSNVKRYLSLFLHFRGRP
jgi:hypothetical protein